MLQLKGLKSKIGKIMTGALTFMALATPALSTEASSYNGSLNYYKPMSGISSTLVSSFNSQNYRDVIWMEATGYSRFDYGCGDYTATGEFVRYGLAAVDTDVIPLGTNLYVEGYGHAIATDTGGAIIGNRIDLAFDSHEEALNWGRRGVNVYIQ